MLSWLRKLLSPTPSADGESAYYNSLIYPLFRGEKLEDGVIEAAAYQGAFRTLKQQSTGVQALSGGDNRQRITNLMRDYQASFRSEAATVEKFIPIWTSEEFNLGELEGIRKFGHHLMSQDQETWLRRLASNWSIGDVKLLHDFNKDSKVRPIFRIATLNGEEFDDKKFADFFKPWKGLARTLAGATSLKASNFKELGSLWGAKRERIELEKTKDIVRTKVHSLENPENFAISNDAWKKAKERGEIKAYWALSSSFDPESGKLKIPDDTPDELREHIKSRIAKHERERITISEARELASQGISAHEVAQTMELQIRTVSYALALEASYKVPLIHAWDFQFDGRRLVDEVYSSNNKQLAGDVKHFVHRIAKTVGNASISDPNYKWLKIRWTVLAVFLAATLITSSLSMLLGWGSQVLASVVIGGGAAFTYGMSLTWSVHLVTKNWPFYVLMAILVVLVGSAIPIFSWSHHQDEVKLSQEYKPPVDNNFKLNIGR